jgi:flagellar motor protein MotB
MKPTASLMIALCAGLLAGCAASVPPTELVNARQAYQHATAGQAALLVPAELHKAQEALAIAEKSFLDEPQSFRTRDLAYVADRKAKMAEALATIAAGNATTAKANKDYQATQTEIVKNTKEDLAASERSGVLKAEQLAAEQQTRIDAEKRAADAQAELARLAAVKEEARGLVITLSGSVLFASSKS